MVVGGWWSVVGGRWSVVGGRWLVVGGRWLVVGGRWSVVGGRWLVVGGLQVDERAPEPVQKSPFTIRALTEFGQKFSRPILATIRDHNQGYQLLEGTARM